MRFVIYPERFINRRRFDREVLATELAPKLKERKTSSPEERAAGLSAEESAKKRADEEKALEEKAAARIKRENGEILRFLESMPQDEAAKIRSAAAKLCENYAKTREAYPQAYEAAYRSALIREARPLWESAKNLVGDCSDGF